MSEAEKQAEEALRWLRFARADLHAARSILGGAVITPHHTCLHSQQAAEKALKALLRANGVPPPPIHDLDDLLDLVAANAALPAPRLDLSQLTDWYIEARYPGPWAEPVALDAERAVATAEDVSGYVRDELERLGISVE